MKISSVEDLAREFARNPHLAPRTATAFALWVRYNNLNGLKRVQAATVQNYCSSIGDFLRDTFRDWCPQDWRLIPGTQLRHPTYNKLLRNFKREDPMRTLRRPFGLRHLRVVSHLTGPNVPLNDNHLLFLWAAGASWFGLRGSEFLDTPHNRALYRQGCRRFNFLQVDDVTFLDRWDRPLAPGTFTRAQAFKVVIRWRWQKNGQNGQTRELRRNYDPLFCPVEIFLTLVGHANTCATRFGREPTNALALTRLGRHITTRMMEIFVRDTIKVFAPSLQTGDLALYTVHSFRIGALERILGLPNMSVPLAVEFLRWRSDAYILYLRSQSADFARLPPADVETIGEDFLTDASYVSDEDEE